MSFPAEKRQLPIDERRPASDQGFSLLELLVTLLLLSIVFIGLAALQVSTIRQVTYSKRSSEATRLAQLVMQRYETMPYAVLQGFSPKDAWVTELERDGTTQMTAVGVDGESDGPFAVQSFHSTIAGGEVVTVRVMWTNMNRGLQTNPDEQYSTYEISAVLQRFQ